MAVKRTSITVYYRRIGLFFMVFAFCCYLALSWDFAHHLTTMNYDEAAYIYKGFLFASQEYRPYAEFGVWTEHMPLAYLVPGYIQLWFGPGMQSARIASVILGMLTLLGLFLTGYRLGGLPWGTALVWVVVLNTGWVKVFSQVFTQGLVSFFVVWMLFFIVGKQSKVWELCAASFLAGLIGMTRINLLPVLVLYLLYLLWSSGWKTTLLAAICGLLPIAALHVKFWPDILKLWAYWLPEDLFPWIAQFRPPWRNIFLPDDFSWWPVSGWINDRWHLAWGGLNTLWLSLRANFVPFFGVLVCVIFWPRKGKWSSDAHRKLGIFFLLVYLTMLAEHIWASLGGKSCQFSCLVGYLIFFNWFGLVLVVVVGISWQEQAITKSLLGARNFFFTAVAFSVALSPAPYFVNGLNTLTCGEDVIAGHERVGAELRAVIPPGATVFWDVKSDMLLLYLPEVKVFMPQTSFRLSLVDDPQADWNQLQRFGWWNKELGENWIQEADYIVFEQRFFGDLWNWNQRVAQNEFEEIFVSSDPESCRAGISNVIILRPVNKSE